MDNAKVKGAIAALFLVLEYIIGSIGVMFFIMVITMFIDYVTGMINAYKHNALDSTVGLWGLIKKVGYFALMAFTCLFDLAILYASEEVGFNVPVQNVFCVLTTMWLFANEGISILENLAGIGVPVPKFLLVGLNRFKDKAEEKGSIEDD